MEPQVAEINENIKRRNVIIVVGVGILFVGVTVLLVTYKPKELQSTPRSSKPVVTKALVPTVKPQIDKTNVKIQVLNGTGVPGEAQKVADFLKAHDYDPKNIKTGNADSFSNKETVLSARSGFENVEEDIRQSLSTLYNPVKLDPLEIDKYTEFDIAIITGPNITPTASPTAQMQK